MIDLLAKLSAQQALLAKQKEALSSSESNLSPADRDESIAGSVPLTPATDDFVNTPGTEDSVDDKTIHLDAAEMLRLKKELDAANNKIARQEQELSQTRATKPNFDQAQGKFDPIERTIGNLQDSFNASSRPFGGRQGSFGPQDDAQSDISDALSAGAFNRAQNIWSKTSGNGLVAGIPGQIGQQYPINNNIWAQGPSRTWMNRPLAPALPPIMVPPQQPHRTYSGPTSPISIGSGRFMNELNQFSGGLKRSNTQNSRSGSAYAPPRGQGWDMYGSGNDGSSVLSTSPTSSYQPMGMFQAPMAYQPRPIGTPLSPTAAEFTTNSGNVGPWNSAVNQSLLPSISLLTLSQPPSSPGQTYVSPMEPLNYRRLLDRSVTCNWKYIVDKIVCNNDQQASIFLQQKLKVGTVEQKFEIVEAIVAQAYPLMVNRFGNFLVQRCFEHGTPDQVISIANAIRGNTLSLSMDAFGCHVVQKAFDAVPEDYKAIMVHELLRRIPETVIHRYACHVWQKLFELRWSDSPPQIMKYVNEALRGMWHEVALGETGSLVVQNIFENCLEEDKVSFMFPPPLI